MCRDTDVTLAIHRRVSARIRGHTIVGLGARMCVKGLAGREPLPTMPL